MKIIRPMNQLWRGARGFGNGILFFMFVGGVFFAEKDAIGRYLSGTNQLPIITELSSNFKTGIELVGKDFFNHIKNNYQDNDIGKILNKDTPWKWQRNEIEQKLQNSLSRRQAIQGEEYLNYIQQYAPLALQEMKNSGIPASVTLAQGLLETNAGDSYIAKAANNHFGIKCNKYKDYRADGYIDDNDFYHHDLAYDCIQIKDDNVWDRFQVYQSPQDSYHHHTLLLEQPRYNWMLMQYANAIGGNCIVDKQWFGTEKVPYYAAWCIGLKKSGYATSKRYAQKLAYIIETYELWRFDYMMVMA